MLSRRVSLFAAIGLGALMAGCASHTPQPHSAEKGPAPEARAPTPAPHPAAMPADEPSKPVVVRKHSEKKESPKKTPPAIPAAAKAEESKPLPDHTVEMLERKIDQNRTREVRAILDKNPGALERISYSEKKLLYIGPKGWRVIDIIEGMRKGRLKEKGVIAHLKKAKTPYRVFSYEEIQFLLKQKLPYRVINTMMVISR